MRHKLLYLFACALTATSVGWGQDSGGETVPEPFSVQKIDQTDLKDNKGLGLFANGHAITIEASTTEGKIKVSTTDMEQNVSYETNGATTIVFGGSPDKSCESSNITMKSGTVWAIVGGGYGTSSEKTAKVTTANINLEGGMVSNFIVGGGALWSEVTTANIRTQGDGTFTHNGWMIPAMESGSSNNSNGKYPEYDKATCKVENFNVTLNKGTYWIIALAGGNGHYAYTKNGKATIKGTAENPVVIQGGLFGCGSNGRGDAAEATVEYCTMSSDALELASVNRGKLKSVDFTFSNCTFSDKIYAYLGGTYKWGEQYASSEVGIPESVKFTFAPSCTGVPTVGISEGLDVANVTLTGAKGKIASFARNNTTNITAFTIGEGKTWTFNDGLEIASDITFTKNGTLKVAATSAEELAAAITLGADTVDLAAGEYALTDKLELKNAVTIRGAGMNKTTIKTTNDKDAFLLSAETGIFVLEDLTIAGVAENKSTGSLNSTAIAFPNTNKFAGALTLNCVKISDYFFGINSAAVAAAQNAPKNTMQIKGCEFVNCYHKAIYTENSELTVVNTTCTDCATTIKSQSGWFTTVALDVNLKYGNYDKVEIIGCTFVHNGTDVVTPPTANYPDAIAYSTALGIKARNDGNTYGANPATLAQATVTGCTFTNNSVGIQLGEPQSNKSNELTAITLSDNTFEGNYNDIINSSTNTDIASEIRNVKGLTDALNFAANGATVNAAAGTYELPAQLRITRPVTLTGAGIDQTIIKAGTADWTGDDSQKNLISVENETDITPAEGGEVVISNLTASNAKRNGLNVQTSMAVKLESVALKENTAGAGLIVHSKVDATDIHTSGNKWAGVNIDKGTPEYSTLCFTFDEASTFAEKLPIYSELYDQEEIVVAPKSWERLVQMVNDTQGVAMWMKRLIVPAGQTLTADETYAHRNVYIENMGTLNVTAPLELDKVTMEEGARLIPTVTDGGKVTATALQLNASLKDSEWKAFGFPSAYKVQSTAEPTTEYTTPTADKDADTGAWFATLKGSTTPEFEYKTDAFGQAGLLSATDGEYAIVSTATEAIELKAATEPEAPTTATFTIFANTGTTDLTLTKNQFAYKLDAATNEYVRWEDATKTLAPFESVILTDENTYSTLRSIGVGDGLVTGNETIVPTDGYYVTTERGAIAIHTAEPVQVLVVGMDGRIAFKGLATDGQRIAVSSGIYAVNGQLVRVK